MGENHSLPAEMDPRRYIEKVRTASGEVLEGEIRPEELLVHHHRDGHFFDIHARWAMSRMLAATGDEDQVRAKARRMRRLGYRLSRWIARLTKRWEASSISRKLFGLKDREHFFRYKHPDLSDREIRQRLERLRERGEFQLAAARRDGGGLRVLLTGGTGFVGREILWQAARAGKIEEVVVLIRPKRVRLPEGGSATLSAGERGALLLDQLGLETPQARRKFRFIPGDVEEPGLGLGAEERRRLSRELTHVIHCAASVAFDAPYRDSFRANVTGTRHALAFSYGLQITPGSPFVAHLGIETSYIHGRRMRRPAREDEIQFPHNYYNNYYELTKAMASLETERYMLERELRVVQLCPSIVIGEYGTGNNRGDTKVVNAPINIFGRARQALEGPHDHWLERTRLAMLARLACIFPGDPSAQINMIPVDWVARGILAALERPAAIGERVHLATDHRLTSERMGEIITEELEVKVRLAEPTLYRTVTLPLLRRVLSRFGQDRLATILSKLGDLFGSYNEWGQPIHQVGNDVRLLGLPEDRPDTERAFRMLCRHNRYVQNFGRVKDLDEISRRERIWSAFLADLEAETGTPAGLVPAADFHRAVAAGLNLDAFARR